MKADRKHELQHNDLDDAASKAITFVRENAAVLGILGGVIVLGLLTYALLLAPRRMDASAGKWMDYILALSDKNAAQELDVFVQDEKKQDDPAVLWARLSLADMQLAKAAQQLFEDRKAAEETLGEAEKNYSSVEKNAGRIAELRDRARVGLAKVYESQNKPDDAIKYYEMVIKSSPETPMGKVATRGRARLAEEENVEFLAWFEKQEPVKKPSRSGSSPFGFDRPLPDTPDFTVPPLGAGPDEKPFTPGLKIPSDIKEIPGTAPPSKTPPADPMPPTKEEEPAATDEPKEKESEKPAEETKPVEEKSADETPADNPSGEKAPE